MNVHEARRTRAAARVAGFLLACAIGWVGAQAALLAVTPGLLASYDLPGHLHMSAVQMRSPTALWDDSWYLGYPTYAYPPLAHRLAGELMKYAGPERGFKAAVAAAYVATIPALYAASREVAGLSSVAAAFTTLVVAISPSLFRALLFGQYSSLVAYPLFMGALAALFACLRPARPTGGMILLAAAAVAVLGATHLYTLLLLLVTLFPLAFVRNPRLLLSRLGLPVASGTLLGLLPSALLLADLHLLSKTPIPHITRSADMLHPGGLLNWVLYPAGFPVVVAILVLAPALLGGWRWAWLGVGLATGLMLYLHAELDPAWMAAGVVSAVLFGAVLRQQEEQMDWRTRYLAWAGLISFWLALGPAGALARLIPFSQILVFDRPLLYGAPLAWMALIRVFWRSGLRTPWKAAVPVAYVVVAGPLLVSSIIPVLQTYARLVPGVDGAFPRGTPLVTDYTDLLKQHPGAGRLLPLGFPPVVYTMPDVTGTPLIDGGYNDARVLTPLRMSGLESLGTEKFINRDLRVTRAFLANAERYAIGWVMTADRYYDPVVPLDRFAMVYDSQPDTDRGIRLYRSLFPPRYAWAGDQRHRTFELARISLARESWAPGGGASTVGVRTVGPGDVVSEDSTFGGRATTTGPVVVVSFRGPMSAGWVSTELAIPMGGRKCNRLTFEAWSPTDAALTVRVVEGTRYRIIRPEAALAPSRGQVRLAVDCQRAERIQIGLSGRGAQRAYLTSLRFEAVEDATVWVPFQRLSAECMRATIPDAGATVTISVPFFPRWQPTESGSGVEIGSDPHGLLTMTGPAGAHTLCLSFPRGSRAARAALPLVYLGLVLVGGLLAWNHIFRTDR